MPVELIQWIMTFVVAACGLVITYSTFTKKKRDDAGSDKANEAVLITKLDFIGNDLKDIKADNRRHTAEIAEVRKTADHALERAEAAHKRLDRAHIDIKD